MVLATVETPMYDIGPRKYIDLKVGDNVLKVKIPWRYNRVMCKVHGIRPIQELKEGELVNVVIENRYWDSENYLVLGSLSSEPHV
jgi:hypothetical protein